MAVRVRRCGAACRPWQESWREALRHSILVSCQRLVQTWCGSGADTPTPCSCARTGRVRGSALSLADGDCRAYHRSPLVGPAVLRADPASGCFGRRGRPMRKPAINGTRRSGAVRCAIYTRKSSEEGLEQAFNSLQAQREACQAFIDSQRHEGWVCLRAGYDDGGCSGATMERPALQQLLADITAGRVDIVVVYKIDRLTRSLADFAKIVEILDARGAF